MIVNSYLIILVAIVIGSFCIIMGWKKKNESLKVFWGRLAFLLPSLAFIIGGFLTLGVWNMKPHMQHSLFFIAFGSALIGWLAARFNWKKANKKT